MDSHDETDRERLDEPLVLGMDSWIFDNDEVCFLIWCLVKEDVNVLVLWDLDSDFHPVLARCGLMDLHRFCDFVVLVMSRTYCWRMDGSPDILGVAMDRGD